MPEHTIWIQDPRTVRPLQVFYRPGELKLWWIEDAMRAAVRLGKSAAQVEAVEAKLRSSFVDGDIVSRVTAAGVIVVKRGGEEMEVRFDD